MTIFHPLARSSPRAEHVRMPAESHRIVRKGNGTLPAGYWHLEGLQDLSGTIDMYVFCV